MMIDYTKIMAKELVQILESPDKFSEALLQEVRKQVEERNYKDKDQALIIQFRGKWELLEI